MDAFLVLRGTKTLAVRMQRHCENARALAAHLEQHELVERVHYPGLASHPQHELARRQMQNFSGMMAVQIEDGEALASDMMQQLSVFHYAVSLGHHRSLIYWMSTDDLVTSSYRLEGEQLERYREFAADGVFRVSVGLEDAVDLCADLEQALG